MTHPVETAHPARKLGRQPEDTARPRLALGSFLRSEVKREAPDVVDYSGITTHWPMYLNDQLGTCTAADAAHAIQVWTGYGQGESYAVSDEDVLAFYSGSTGYDPRRPETDQGGTMQEVNEYFRKVGMAGRTIEAFFRVSTDDLDELRTALWLFGAVSVGMAFPAWAMDQFESGQPWHIPTTTPRNNWLDGGHDVLLVGARKGGNLLVVTWGRLQEVTPRFWAKYMGSGAGGEAWARVETDWASKSGVAPANALDVAALNQAFVDLTGQPGPFPAVAPQPDPAPAPQPNPQPDTGESQRGCLLSVADDLGRVADKLRRLAAHLKEDT